MPKVYENIYDSEPKNFGSTENLLVACRRCMKTQVMKAPRADEKQRARAEMWGGWAGGGGKEGSREEFKRGNLRQPELINPKP